MWTAAARNDLLEDYIYIARDNPLAAERFVFDIEDKIRAFAENGLTGVQRDELEPGARSFVHKDRVIVFLVSDSELKVLRIFHGHQDISSKDFEQED